jgi:hypothetical protein
MRNELGEERDAVLTAAIEENRLAERHSQDLL